MSRIGKKLVPVPAGVTVAAASGKISVKGPKGTLDFPLYGGISIKSEGGNVQVNADSKGDRQIRAYHGLTRATLVNMIEGVTKGYEKKLLIEGVGWTAKINGKQLELAVGFCLPVMHKIPDGLTVTCPTQTSILVTGADKQKVGQFSAEVRASRPPEPYNGKGIKYDGEVIRRKAGKTFAATGA